MQKDEQRSVGQRVISVGEPALGLGIVEGIDDKSLTVAFPAAMTHRVYSARQAPIHRVVYRSGDTIKDRHGSEFEITGVREDKGIITYHVEGGELPEIELNDRLVLDRADQALLAGQIQTPRSYDVRHEAWQVKYQHASSPVRGLTGGRIELVPHQIYLAAEVGKRHAPRVLLSDAVGLGKTVEAGLIFHQRWVRRQAQRVLCLTPSSLLHQWLLELMRKFNSVFQVMDATQWQDLKTGDGDMNPYECHQCIIQSLDDLLSHAKMKRDLLAVPWDMVIVDEAHHLNWRAGRASKAYRLVEKLATTSPSLVLITATPHQLGLETHFGLLRLIDPGRFPRFEDYQREVARHEQIAAFVERLNQQTPSQIREELGQLFPEDDALQAVIPGNTVTDAQIRNLVAGIIDRHGTGRMVFRNRRSVLEARLPRRNVQVYPLDPGQDYLDLAAANGSPEGVDQAQTLLAGPPAWPRSPAPKGSREGKGRVQEWCGDPRPDWLIDFLKRHHDEKILLICSRVEVVTALHESLYRQRSIECAMFHEHMSLLERDRQAAFFAQEGGAQILLCSEIGSEGRNFQFAQHLILFDLPLHPGLLVQRIGRLDRIGQKTEIFLHIPFIRNTLHERVHAWYQQALDAFHTPLYCADEIHDHLSREIQALVTLDQPEPLDSLIQRSREKVEQLLQTLERGRDKLLERHSFDEQVADHWIQKIEAECRQDELKNFMTRLFDVCGVQVRDVTEEIQFVEPGAHMYVDSFPGLPKAGLTVTYSRATAVAREDTQFLTLDHPMVTEGIEMIHAHDRGMSSLGVIQGAPRPGFLVQCLFVLEAAGLEETGFEHFLPPTPLEVTVDHTLSLRADTAALLCAAKIKKGPPELIHRQRDALTDILDRLLPVARKDAEQRAATLRGQACRTADVVLQSEIVRMQQLQKINASVRDEEIEFLARASEEVKERISQASVRLDAIRLIMLKK